MSGACGKAQEMTDPAFATAEEFARLVETGADALARTIAYELHLSQDEAYARVKAASADLDSYLREGKPEFWASITRTRVRRAVNTPQEAR